MARLQIKVQNNQHYARGRCVSGSSFTGSLLVYVSSAVSAYSTI